MKARLMDNTVVHFNVGRAWAGTGFKEVTLTLADTQNPQFDRYFRETVMCRLVPRRTHPPRNY